MRLFSWGWCLHLWDCYWWWMLNWNRCCWPLYSDLDCMLKLFMHLSDPSWSLRGKQTFFRCGFFLWVLNTLWQNRKNQLRNFLEKSDRKSRSVAVCTLPIFWVLWKRQFCDLFQEHTCKLLSDTVECGELWKRCHSAGEVRTIQDTHIQARITQFRDNREGIDVFKCPVVEEYINSGRADQIDQSTEGACSLAEVSNTRNASTPVGENLSK